MTGNIWQVPDDVDEMMNDDSDVDIDMSLMTAYVSNALMVFDSDMLYFTMWSGKNRYKEHPLLFHNSIGAGIIMYAYETIGVFDIY